jgi:hypothetical protein
MSCKGVLSAHKSQSIKSEQIITLLRQIDALTINGKTITVCPNDSAKFDQAKIQAGY